MARLVQERKGSHQAEVRFTRSDGELRYALVSVSLPWTPTSGRCT